ncbi:MAG TPA: triose-phosphate isomerase [Candidatus Paceibacterota bacterium]|jgi:triosephosphate isomerase|nr:triose-phosphate isomerase [Candidatus Paceibacterota bacterium]
MKKLIVANWKMNPQSQKEAEIVFNGIVKIAKSSRNIDIIVCPPFPFLSIGKKIKIKIKNLMLGAQNASEEAEGAYTGEVSPKMLAGLGVKYVIVGHSERRALGETDQTINKKIINALKSKISPILCIGESIRDAGGDYLSFIKQELHECLKSIPKAQISNIVVAYEPIWAIGENANREATPEEFTEARILIRKIISDLYDSKTAHSVMILYGGSVHEDNAKEFMLNGGADGLLVGRDSLSPKKFALIINAAK